MFKKAKSADPAEPFVVPSLAEVDSDYAAFVAKRVELTDAQTETIRERKRIERELEQDGTPLMRPGVAALLGDPSASARLDLRVRLSELRTRAVDLEAALAELRKRENPVQVKASAAARERVKPEYARRVRALADALVVARQAQQDVANLVEEMEREEILWSPLGDFRASSMGITRFITEARAAGYWEASR